MRDVALPCAVITYAVLSGKSYWLLAVRNPTSNYTDQRRVSQTIKAAAAAAAAL